MISGLVLVAAMLWGEQSAEATAATPSTTTAPCAQINATTFLLKGDVNDAMTACVRDKLSASTTDLIVDSNGGQAAAALDIADLLEPLHLTVHVRRGCYSACAIYFLPIADRLIVEPGAAIIRHGGMDPKFLHEWNEGRQDRMEKDRKQHPDLSPAEITARADAADAKVQRTIQRQREFAERHGVGLGWFLYRDAGDSDVGRWLSGKHGPKP